MAKPDSRPRPGLLHFAQSVYALPDVQTLCLRLQDEQDVDVVLLLMCCWHGCCRGLLSQAQFEQAAAFSGTWTRQLVKPLRQSRRWLKSHPSAAIGVPGADQEDLRQRIKAIELDAEFMQLRALASMFADVEAGHGDAATAVHANLALYARLRALNLDDRIMATLTQASLHCV
ncbi:MAG: TIGR02444 family protein [Pseudohongiella sp.]|uniref:TIGR02444 family protein n=1 Tax=Pseudohongiella sp. TaxID=1979412 RepID=UPI0034A01384